MIILPSIGAPEGHKACDISRIGPWEFDCQFSADEGHIQERNRWFRRHEPVPVTKRTLKRQLLGRMAQWETLKKIGEGAFGHVYKVMEKQTGLMLALKNRVWRMMLWSAKDPQHESLESCKLSVHS